MVIKGNVKRLKNGKIKAKHSFGLQKARAHVFGEEKSQGEPRRAKRRKKRKKKEEEKSKNQVCLCLVTIGNWILGLWHGELLLLGLGFWNRSPKP